LGKQFTYDGVANGLALIHIDFIVFTGLKVWCKCWACFCNHFIR